ncbi:MAG TPA: HEAT repeat domain-containing protein [Armatimonadota bacterium]|nr:HEAT repeat domain-containing protein [Armatimonadota bacterium]
MSEANTGRKPEPFTFEEVDDASGEDRHRAASHRRGYTAHDEFRACLAALREQREAEGTPPPPPVPPAPVARVDAVRALRERPTEAFVPLCDALRDKDLNVRIAAAEVLGELGDERAVQPLTEALRACFVGRSGRMQVITGVFAFVAAALFFVGIVFGAFSLKFFGCAYFVLQLAAAPGKAYFKRRRSRSPLCHAITEALTRIADRHPTPELRSVLPDLRAVAADSLQQEKGTRAASRAAADRIDALTEKLQSLPLPATTPAPDGATLPRPADAPTPQVETLPRVQY